MKIFYYPALPSQAADMCLSALEHENGLYDITALPGGCKLNCYRSLNLRSGDIMILFAANRQEIEELLQLRDELEDFRIILITKDPCEKECRQKIHQLAPRFFSTMHERQGLNAVIDKMMFRDKEREQIFWSQGEAQ